MLALLPLIGYLLLLSSIRISGRALITTASRDIAALGVAISGLVAIGPAELFFPGTAAAVFGPWVWFAIATLYALCLALLAITSTPKLVIYGRTVDQTFEPLVRAAQKLDPSAVGDDTKAQISMPNAGIQLRVEGQPGSDCSQVFSFEPNLSPTFWSRLQGNLRSEFAKETVPRNLRGLGMLSVAFAMIAFLVWYSVGEEDLVVEGFRKWLWR